MPFPIDCENFPSFMPFTDYKSYFQSLFESSFLLPMENQKQFIFLFFFDLKSKIFKF